MHPTMSIIWNPTQHTDQENLQWSWLRAVEWGVWPLFLSSAFAPLLLLVMNAWTLIVLLALATLAWVPVRYRLVSARLAGVGAVVALARWIVGPLAAILFFRGGHWRLAILALLWPSVMGAIGAMFRPQVGKIQVELMRQLGYEPTESNPLSAR